MSESVLNQTEDYFGRLETALGGSTSQNREVLEEVRSDFLLRVEALRGEDVTEGEAVRRVLDEMGSPESLAAGMKAVLPPLSHGWVRGVRYVLAGMVVIWTLMLMWTFRAWDYGWSVGSAFSLALHLPAIFLLWPGLIWRRNWLFGVLPAGIAVLVALCLASLGTESTQEIPLSLDAAAVVEPVAQHVIPWQAWVLLCSLVVFAVVLLGAMQRAVQRRLVLMAVILPMVAVEGSFQWEEWQFRRQRDLLAEVVRAGGDRLSEKGSLADVGIEGPGAEGCRYSLSEDGKDFTLWWDRPLSGGFAICYSSGDGRLWVND